MELSRRDFLKASGAGVGGIFLLGALSDEALAKPIKQIPLIKSGKETTSVCCYCSVGCGLICSTDANGKIINIEGDPDHPISEGTLCAKGANIMQITADNKHRLTDVLYRAPYSDKWEKKDWDWAITRIAENIKTARDADFITTNSQGKTVNRVETISLHGSSNINNEECFMAVSAARALGLVYVDHQARV